eukprot:c7371_g1_i2.p1 GENE.c7371_g1_i2~~c7371_g1_i2.p1  ORF type:complete len:209 (-),score=53.26 c7371_g1_i2:200-826(-)
MGTGTLLRNIMTTNNDSLGLGADLEKLRQQLKDKKISQPPQSQLFQSQSKPLMKDGQTLKEAMKESEELLMHTPSAVSEAALRAAVDAKEKLVENELFAKQKVVREEAARLQIIEQELEALRVQEAHGINHLRNRLEELDREILIMEREFAVQEKLYLATRDALHQRRSEKKGIQNDLTKILLSSQKKKEEKLNHLIAQMKDETHTRQ